MRVVGAISKLFPVLLLAAAGVLYVFSVHGDLPPFVPILVGAIAVVALGRQVWRLKQNDELIAHLHAAWGKAEDRERDFEALAARYQLCRANAADDSLDDATWVDLNMDEVYEKLDRTHTSAGELMLYRMLRDLVNSPDSLASRSRAIQRISDDATLRDALRVRLYDLGRRSQTDLAGLLWGGHVRELGQTWIYNLLAMAAVLSLFSVIPLGLNALVMAVVPIYLINTYLTFATTKDDVLIRLRTLRYLSKLITIARDLAQLGHPDLAPWTEPMGRAAAATLSVVRRITILSPEGRLWTEIADALLYHVSLFFLVEVRTYNRVMRDVLRLGDDLKTVVRLVGELDALQSAASFRRGLDHYCDPEFTEGPRQLGIEDGWHPLVITPVPNSVQCKDDDLFITGSNMAGKSTFLRMAAINVILAQTIHTCCAKAYRGTMFRITSSISHMDEVASGTSYFMAEAERLLHVIQCAETNGTPFLCVIDEMLRGTNSVERHAASLAILQHLARTPALIIVASHDTELGDMLKKNYQLHHFAESFEDNEMTFDYQLKLGVSAAGNALRTLDYIGFPDEVIKDARKHLKEILKGGGIYRTPQKDA